MSEMSEIYEALMSGRSATESLATWVTNAEGSELVRWRLDVIKRGIAAHERLSAQLRDGRKHIEPPEEWKPTGCMCQWPNANPPCSWCTDPANSEESP